MKAYMYTVWYVKLRTHCQEPTSEVLLLRKDIAQTETGYLLNSANSWQFLLKPTITYIYVSKFQFLEGHMASHMASHDAAFQTLWFE